jgi:phosphatidate cytidylyltransferase
MKSNLLTRVLIAFTLGPLILYLALVGKIPFLVFVELLVIVGLWEYLFLVKSKGIQIQSWILLPLGMLFPVSAFLFGEQVFLFFFLAVVYLTALVLILKGKTQGATADLATSFFALFYVAGLFSFLILLRELPLMYGADYKIGGLWIIYLLLCIWSCDTFAYFIGAPLGKHKLSPNVSPNKTVEGFFGGILGAVAAAFFCYYVFFRSAQLEHLLVVASFVALIGQMGDLAESLFKRDAQIKDISKIIPGHGGILDRFDSLLFVSPVVYYYLKFVVYS